MKILIPVDPEIPVPPPLYGGVERLVDGLVRAYVASGHQVVILAHPDSGHDDARVYGWSAVSSRGTSNSLRNALRLFNVCRKEKPQAIHSFCRLLYLYPSVLLLRIPAVMTYGRFISPRSTALASFAMGKQLTFTSVAGHMLDHLKKYRYKFTHVYNFTEIDYYRPDEKAEKEHLMFLGRIEDIKGTRECIEVALRTGDKLVIAGNIQPGHEHYFRQNIEPHLDNPLIHYTGPVDNEQKRHLLQRAKALLFPIKWEEPFGIVMAEAMACGTPVIGFKRGSVPEVIRNGYNGFISPNLDDMVKAVGRLPEIDREKVRADCTRRFSLPVIAGQYLEIIQNHVHASH